MFVNVIFLIPRHFFSRNRRDGGEEGEDLGSPLSLIFSAKTHRLTKLSVSADKAVWRNVGLSCVTLYVQLYITVNGEPSKKIGREIQKPVLSPSFIHTVLIKE